jgi:hypothetical protein
MTILALALAATIAAPGAPAAAVDAAATAAKVELNMKRLCPWVPIQVQECNNSYPCAQEELQRVISLNQRCNDNLKRVLACSASGTPVDVCIQAI